MSAKRRRVFDWHATKDPDVMRAYTAKGAALFHDHTSDFGMIIHRGGSLWKMEGVTRDQVEDMAIRLEVA